MLDSSWDIYEEFIPTFELVRKHGGKIVTMVYDLIPILFPGVVTKGLETVFRTWLNTAIQQSDMLVCISRSTADEVKAYISKLDLHPKQRIDITYFHLGADIPVTHSEANIRREVSELATTTYLRELAT
jgi:hypothetical protein